MQDCLLKYSQILAQRCDYLKYSPVNVQNLNKITLLDVIISTNIIRRFLCKKRTLLNSNRRRDWNIFFSVRGNGIIGVGALCSSALFCICFFHTVDGFLDLDWASIGYG